MIFGIKTFTFKSPPFHVEHGKSEFLKENQKRLGVEVDSNSRPLTCQAEVLPLDQQSLL